MKDKIFLVKEEKESLGFLMWQTTILWQREIKKSLKKYNLTHPQFVIMTSIIWLELQKKDINQIKLSNHTKIDKVTTGNILSILIKKQLISRELSQKDNRAYIIKSTQKGFELSKKVIKEIEKIDIIFFEKVSADDRLNLKKILSKITN